MLARYQMLRGARQPGDPLPDGIRQDTRKHTRHFLRPSKGLVDRYLGDASDAGWDAFQQQYLALIRERFAEDRQPFDDLAVLARREDVYLGCSCPTAKNPDVNHCHTVLALRFMQETYRDLSVVFP